MGSTWIIQDSLYSKVSWLSPLIPPVPLTSHTTWPNMSMGSQQGVRIILPTMEWWLDLSHLSLKLEIRVSLALMAWGHKGDPTWAWELGACMLDMKQPERQERRGGAGGPAPIIMVQQVPARTSLVNQIHHMGRGEGDSGPSFSLRRNGTSITCLHPLRFPHLLCISTSQPPLPTSLLVTLANGRLPWTLRSRRREEAAASVSLLTRALSRSPPPPGCS